MSSVKQKREQVLETIYDKLYEEGLDDFMPNADSTSVGPDGKLRIESQKNAPIVQLIVALENANAADEENAIKEKELSLKEDTLAFENAHHEIDRKHDDRNELIRLVVTSGVTLVTSVLWGVIMVHEMRATRLFEVEGTETSAVGRWLKQSFPKPRLL